MRNSRRLAATAAVLALALTACAESERDDAAGGDGGSGATLVFGVPGEPAHFDPLFSQDGETFRPARQIYDTLVTYELGTAELAPGLATEWTPNDEGTEWTFTLREGVTFHDGTPFDAEAVCANFERWHALPGAAAQSQAIYYTDTFGGFADNQSEDLGESIYAGCEAAAPNTAVLSLTEPKGAFPAAFGLTSLSIGSPTAMAEFDADTVEQSGEAFTYSAYATENPTGTGPFRFESYDRTDNVITLVRNDDYWGEPAQIERLIFRVIPDENARQQELQAGTIDGYDFPPPAQWDALREAGHQLLIRDSFNILYLGINQANNPALADLRVRQAIAHALDREALVQTQLPEGAEVATQFVPEAVAGHAPDIEPIPYDPDRARELLAQAGQEDLALDFYYPTDVTRPYMPNPTDIFSALSENLRQVGITVNPVAQPWNGGYLDSTTVNGTHDLHLLGWTGDYNDAGNFIGTFFGRQKPEFGFDNPELFAALDAAGATVGEEENEAAYQQVNQQVMEYLPAVPVSHSPPALVVREGVDGLVPSPLTDERFYTAAITE